MTSTDASALNLSPTLATSDRRVYACMLQEFTDDYLIHHPTVGEGSDWYVRAHDNKLAAMIGALRSVLDQPANENEPDAEQEIIRLRQELAERDAMIDELKDEITAHEMRYIVMLQRISELEDE